MSPDWRSELGRTYVAPGEVAAPRILDPPRMAALDAWTACLIPGDDHWPGARDVGAAAYIDAVVARSAVLRPLLLRAIDALRLGERPVDEHEDLLRAFARDDETGAFDLVYELTCEAYYRDEGVMAVMVERTGFDLRLQHLGSHMEPFDERLLDRVRSLPPRYREVPE